MVVVAFFRVESLSSIDLAVLDMLDILPTDRQHPSGSLCGATLAAPGASVPQLIPKYEIDKCTLRSAADAALPYWQRRHFGHQCTERWRSPWLGPSRHRRAPNSRRPGRPWRSTG